MNTLIRNARAIYCAPESHTHHESQISVNHSNPAVPTDIRIRDGVITEIGNQLLPTDDEQVIDASGCVVWPGLVNTHHHLAQSVLKGVPEGLNQALGDWLGSVPYRFWPKISPQLMYHAARLGLYELLRSGATTCADHHYLYHADSSPEVEDAVWAAADELGIRLVLCRGSATVQGSHKGMLKHGIQPENVELVMQRMERSYRQYHQAGDNAMRRLVVAPTSLVHSATADDLRTLAAWARERQLKLHSHLLEVSFDDIQAQEKYGQRAIDYAASCDWLGNDVWFAHLVKSAAGWADDLRHKWFFLLLTVAKAIVRISSACKPSRPSPGIWTLRLGLPAMSTRAPKPPNSASTASPRLACSPPMPRRYQAPSPKLICALATSCTAQATAFGTGSCACFNATSASRPPRVDGRVSTAVGKVRRG